MERQFFPLSPKEAEKAGVKYTAQINKDSEFAQRLKALRENPYISQQKLADEIGVTKSTIGLYENGDNVPDAKTLYKIAKFFNVSGDYLLGLTDVKTNNYEVKKICNYVGLSDITVEHLHDLLERYRETKIEPLAIALIDTIIRNLDISDIEDNLRRAATAAATSELYKIKNPDSVLLDALNTTNIYSDTVYGEEIYKGDGSIRLPARDVFEWYIEKVIKTLNSRTAEATKDIVLELKSRIINDRNNYIDKWKVKNPSDAELFERVTRHKKQEGLDSSLYEEEYREAILTNIREVDNDG
jgi:transcriptional regulator with XRE-family HTH domain